MRNKLTKISALAVVGCMCLFSACVRQPQTQIVVLRSYISTNQIPGYIGGPKIEPQVDSNGWLQVQAVPAVAVAYPPRKEVVTNYVLGYLSGTNEVELWTAEKR